MPEEHGVIRRVVWQQICPWLILFRVFRLSISLPVLLLGGCGALLTPMGWQVADFVFISNEEDTDFQRIVERNSRWPEYTQAPVSIFDRETSLGLPQLSQLDNVRAVYLRFTEPFWHFTVGGSESRVPRAAYFLFGGLWNFAVWSLFAGAITRIAAVQLGREERISLKDAMTHALRNYGWYMASPFFPLIGVILLGVPLWLAGLVMRFSLGVLVAGLFWWLAILGGLGVTVLLLGLMFGWPLMWPALSSEEGGDAFDAFSRSYSYTFQRPLHYLFFVTIVVLFGGLCWFFVSQFSAAVVDLPLWIASWGTGQQGLDAIMTADPGGIRWAGSRMILGFNKLVMTLASGFNYSFFFCSATAIYLLLRREYDQTELDEVFVVEQEEQYGLPPLAAENAGEETQDQD